MSGVDHGAPWLSKAPQGWTKLRLRNTVTGCFNGLWGDEPDGIDDLVCIRVADFDRDNLRVSTDSLTLRSIPLTKRVRRTLRHGDLLLEKSGGGDLQPVGAVVMYDQTFPAVCSNFLARLPPAPGFHGRFLTYIHSALYATRVNTRSIKQTTGIQNLDSGSYLDETVAVPGLPVQRAIADFLDRKTAAIDELIRKKERLIELLQEKRQALITQAVTKGLDPNVPMKHSGIEWLGEIPAHWKLKRLKHISPKQHGRLIVSPNKYIEDEGIPIVFGFNIRKGKIDRNTVRHIGFQYEKQFRSHTVSSGDLLCVRVGAPGETAVVPPELHGCHFASTMQIIQHSTFHSPWLAHAFNSGVVRHQIKSVQYGAAQEQINVGDAVNFIIPTPPHSEQKEISAMLDVGLTHLASIESSVSGQIDRLKEYRQSLISAAVTGQLPIPPQAPA